MKRATPSFRPTLLSVSLAALFTVNPVLAQEVEDTSLEDAPEKIQVFQV